MEVERNSLIGFKKKCCIYLIRNSIDRRVYVGSSVDLRKRIQYHIQGLSKNKHHSRHLQRFVNKYGIKSLTFEIVEEIREVNKENIIKKEQIYLDFYKSYTPEGGFNCNKIADSRLGSKMSNESRMKMSVSKTGRKLSKERIEEIRHFMLTQHPLKGVPLTEEHRKKLYKPVLQFDKNNNFIKRWESLQSAANGVGTTRANISCALTGNSKTAKKFIWRYDNGHS